jgi:hypothetical protein
VRLKAFDFVIALAATALVAATAVLAYGPGGGQDSLVIKGVQGEWVYPLAADRDIEVQGPLGSTIVEIRDKQAFIEDSPCPNKTCIAAGAISKPGQWVACLPNEVVLRVEGRRADAGVDATVF